MKSADYLKRTEANVVDSDATLVFTYGDAAGGSLRTIQFAAKHQRPCLHVDLNNPRDQITTKITAWLKGISIPEIVLNVAGSRESKAPGIQHAVMVRMVDAISEANGTLFYPLLDEGLSGWIIKEDSPGTVVRLRTVVDGVEPGYYILLGQNADMITLSMAGEDDKGDIVATDKVVHIPSRHAADLHPTKIKVDVPPQT